MTKAKEMADHLMTFINAHRGRGLEMVLVVADPNDLDTVHVDGTAGAVDRLKMAGVAVEKLAAELQNRMTPRERASGKN